MDCARKTDPVRLLSKKRRAALGRAQMGFSVSLAFKGTSSHPYPAGQTSVWVLELILNVGQSRSREDRRPAMDGKEVRSRFWSMNWDLDIWLQALTDCKLVSDVIRFPLQKDKFTRRAQPRKAVEVSLKWRPRTGRGAL